MRSLVTLCACFGSAASLTVEVLRSEFDAHGYHLVMARGPFVRHIQFKTGLTVSGRRGRTFKEGEDERLYLFRTDSALGNKYTELPPGSLCRNGGRMLFFMKSSAGSDRVLLIASVTHLVSFQKNAPQACALTSFGRQ